MHLHSNPLAQIAIYERTEPFSERIAKWAKTVDEDAAAPFRGMDDTVWYAVKKDVTTQIFRTHWHWKDIQEACDNFDRIRDFSGATYVTSIYH